MTQTTSAARGLAAGAALLCLALSGAAGASFDMFLKVDGIKGESADSRHRDEIDVLSWSWGVAAREEARAGKRGCVQGLTFTKQVDRATPPLVQAAALGTQIPRATLAMRKAGEGQADFYVVELTQVLVSSLQQAASGAQDRLVEEVALQAGSIAVSYRRQNPDGSLSAPVTASVSGGC